MIETVIVPAGTYVLGDPCYTIEDNLWDEAIDKTDCFERPSCVMDDGRFVLGFGTAYGDGTYKGSDGVSYGVDAGLIGLVSVPNGYTTERDDISVIVFEYDTAVFCENGVMTFGNVIIDTDPEPEWDDDYYWREDIDYDEN